MLGTIRENKNSTFIAVLVGLIVVAFIAWGPAVNSRSSGTTTIARVNGVSIPPSLFYQRVRDQAEGRRRSGSPISDEEMAVIRAQVLDDLIERELIRQEANRLGVVASDEEIRNQVLSSFKKDDGSFDEKAWTRAKKHNPSLERNLRESIQVEKMQAFIRDSVTVTESDVRDLFVEQNTKINLEYARFNFRKFEAEVQVTPEQRAEFLKIHDAEVRAQYDRDFDKVYRIPKKVHARHILLKFNEGDTEEVKAELRQRLEAVLALAKGGADFQELAKEYSEDGSAPEGGDLGFFDETKMVPEFSAVAFRTPAGEISDIVQTKFGLHIIKVEAVEEAMEKSYDDVRDEIVDQMIKREKAPELAKAAAEKVKAVWTKQGEEVEKVLSEVKVSIQETGLTSRTGDSVRGLGSSAELADTAFALEAGAPPVDRIFELADSVVLIRLKERQEADLSGFEAEKERLQSLALRTRQRKVIDAWVDSLKASADEIYQNPRLLGVDE